MYSDCLCGSTAKRLVVGMEPLLVSRVSRGGRAGCVVVESKDKLRPAGQLCPSLHLTPGLSETIDHCFTSTYQISHKFLFWPPLTWDQIGNRILGILVSSLTMLIIEWSVIMALSYSVWKDMLSVIYYQKMANILRVYRRVQKHLVINTCMHLVVHSDSAIGGIGDSIL